MKQHKEESCDLHILVLISSLNEQCEEEMDI